MQLNDWLSLLERRHPQAIELGLDRVAQVWARLKIGAIAHRVITVGGTNGKGSTVALIEAIAREHGARVACYTSPHILRFNERIALDGRPVDDQTLIRAFEQVDAALAGVSLSYFEFTTLAALIILSEAKLDLAVLEVGLGGRLDAVNLIDADAAVITSVDLDHQAWLGPTIEDIGWEKAHIFRAATPAICGLAALPLRLRAHAAQIGARLECLGREFVANVDGNKFSYSDLQGTLSNLALPALRAPVQLANAACAIRALRAIGYLLESALVSAALKKVKLRARLEQIRAPISTFVDVAHNAEAARSLAAWLATSPIAGRNHAIFACLEDKDLDAIVQPLLAHFASWSIVQLEGPRARDASEISAHIRKHAGAAPVLIYDNVAGAMSALATNADSSDRIIAFGSFLLAEQALSPQPIADQPIADQPIEDQPMWNEKKLTLPDSNEALPGRSQPMSISNRHFVHGRPLEGAWPGAERIYLGMGCFWGAERKFWSMAGIHSTAVGYSGGHTQNPSYAEVCSGMTGHNEVVQLTFDPAELDAILKVFWEAHNPTQGMRQGNDRGTQYRSAIYCTTAAQLERALESRRIYAERLARAGFPAITTEVLEATAFYYAEDDHQQYLAKNPGGYCGLGGTGVSCTLTETSLSE